MIVSLYHKLTLIHKSSYSYYMYNKNLFFFSIKSQGNNFVFANLTTHRKLNENNKIIRKSFIFSFFSITLFMVEQLLLNQTHTSRTLISQTNTNAHTRTKKPRQTKQSLIC